MLTYNTDSRCSQRSICSLKPQIVNTHSSCCPYHSDESFQNHHVVECHAALFLALHSTGNNSSLCRMESRKDTAGNCDKENRNKMISIEVIAIRHYTVPVTPQFYKGISLYKQANKHTNS